MIFLVPNAGETLRVSGKADILSERELCESFAIAGKPASSVLSIQVEKVYYQCQKALARSRLWNPPSADRPQGLPTAGQLAKHFSAEHGVELDAESYDADYADQLKNTSY